MPDVDEGLRSLSAFQSGNCPSSVAAFHFKAPYTENSHYIGVTDGNKNLNFLGSEAVEAEAEAMKNRPFPTP